MKQPDNRQRIILHADMDAFFASVEQHDRPELREQPVIVCGTGARGVVSAASYAARRFGIHSAMPTREARKRCPHGIFIAPRINRYREVSEQVFAAMRSITPLVEGLSLDEAFLDITGSVKLFGGARNVGEALRQRIQAETGLAVSIGIAPNKFVAKIASDLEKPAGFVLVAPDDVRAFLDPLPVSRLWGLGPKTLPRVQESGLHTFRDFRLAKPELLRALLGRQAERFRQLASGIDERTVEPVREDKSVSAEETFERDLHELSAVEGVLLALTEKVAGRLRRDQLLPRTLTLKIRERDFTTHSRSHTFAPASNDTRVLFEQARRLLQAWWQQHPGAALRLLGVGTSQFETLPQDDLFADSDPVRQRNSRLDALVDSVRDRFGGDALKRARLLEDGK